MVLEKMISFIYLLSVLPFFESRYAIIILKLIYKNISFYHVIFLSILNSLIFFPLIIFLDKLHSYFYDNFDLYKKLFDKYILKIRKKTQEINELKYLGLFIYTFFPLPGSGVYTSTLISWITNLNKRKSFISIFFAIFLWNSLIYIIA